MDTGIIAKIPACFLTFETSFHIFKPKAVLFLKQTINDASGY